MICDAPATPVAGMPLTSVSVRFNTFFARAFTASLAGLSAHIKVFHTPHPNKTRRLSNKTAPDKQN